VRSWVGAMTMSVDEWWGMTVVMGNHAKVSATHSALVLQAHTR
jgi:hypothetical protein